MTFLEEVKRPFNIITLTLTIVSLILSIVFYKNGIREKKITYQISEPASLIFDSKNSSSTIKLIENDSIIISDNVYLLSGTIWNNGDLPILKSDVRQKITFVLNGSKRILDFKIIKQKDSSISNFKLSKLNSNSLMVDWDYFDPNYGFKYQIMYLGNENSKFEVKGKILDITDFNRFEYNQKSKIPNWAWYAITTFILTIVILIIWRLYIRRNEVKWSISYLILLLAYLAIMYYILTNIILIEDIPI